MAKLANPFPEGLYVTQGNHSTFVVDGVPMNRAAFDFAGGRGFYAPWDCVVTRVYTVKPAYLSYFFILLPDGSQIFVAHAKPDRTGAFKKGEMICSAPIADNPTGPHYHVAIMVNRRWCVLLDFIDRTTPIAGVFPFGNWWKYSDLSLPLTQDVTLQVTALIGLRVRQQPNTRSAQLGLLKYGTKIISSQFVTGEAVGGDTTWWTYGGGYVSNKFLKHV